MLEPTLNLSDTDQANLSGENGPVLQFAARMVTRAAELMGAAELIDVSFVHIDACHYYGQAHVDFAQMIVDAGCKVAVPSWTNTVPVSVEVPDMRPPEKWQASIWTKATSMSSDAPMGSAARVTIWAANCRTGPLSPER